jgi:lipoate-protein ligase A
MPFQMALDEILFRRRFEASGTPPLFRCYFSSPRWISAGTAYVRKLENQQTRMALWPARGNFCRRITGGGLVGHGDDVMFTLLARKSDDDSFGSVRASYQKIHEAVACALAARGIESDVFPAAPESPSGPRCFEFPVATDLSVNGRKAAGGGQKRSSGSLMHQESIQKIKGFEADDWVVPLYNAFQEIFGVSIEPVPADPALLHEAEDLGRSRYLIR